MKKHLEVRVIRRLLASLAMIGMGSSIALAQPATPAEQWLESLSHRIETQYSACAKVYKPELCNCFRKTAYDMGNFQVEIDDLSTAKLSSISTEAQRSCTDGKPLRSKEFLLNENLVVD